MSQDSDSSVVNSADNLLIKRRKLLTDDAINTMLQLSNINKLLALKFMRRCVTLRLQETSVQAFVSSKDSS